jgi:hypothetical protein
MILALILAATTTGVFAAPMAADSDNGQTTASQAGTFQQQNEAEKVRLDRAGFPQYTN